MAEEYEHSGASEFIKGKLLMDLFYLIMNVMDHREYVSIYYKI